MFIKEELNSKLKITLFQLIYEKVLIVFKNHIILVYEYQYRTLVLFIDCDKFFLFFPLF